MLYYWITPYKREFFIPGRKYSIQEPKCTPDKDGFVKTKLIMKRLVEKDQQMSSGQFRFCDAKLKTQYSAKRQENDILIMNIYGAYDGIFTFVKRPFGKRMAWILQNY